MANQQKKNNARLPNIQAIISAGIDPKTGLPLKMTAGMSSELENGINQLITLIDRTDALGRYQWFNLPDGLDNGNMIERILYYKGSGMMFYEPTNNKFYFLPYSLNGSIDIYGRYLTVKPLPFGGSTSTETENKVLKAWTDSITRDVQYEVQLPSELSYENAIKKCVILKDYDYGISQEITPREILNRPLINLESEMLPLLRTSLISSAGVAGMRVSTEDEYSNVAAAAKSSELAAKSGQRWIPIVGNVDFQSLDTSNIANAQEFLLSMNAVDNLRLSTLGITNGGLFEKQGTILQSEANTNSMNTGYLLQSGLQLRQNFCNIVNSLFGTSIWCEINQPQLLPPATDMMPMGDGSEYNGENRDSSDNSTDNGDDSNV